jgi:RNA polymerase sigma-70 factor (ECF subfamily)
MDTQVSTLAVLHEDPVCWDDECRQTTDVDLQAAVAVFMAQRPQLITIADRILGSEGGAEDVVQEAWLRWQRTDRGIVDNPPGFLATATTRLALNVRQSARSRHERAFTPWLENVMGPVEAPGATVEREQEVESALRVLTEALTPAELAAYVLRTSFGYPYSEVAEVLRLNAPNVRQLVSRAHARLVSGRRRRVSLDGQRSLVRAFLLAARSGDLGELETVLTADVGRGAGRSSAESRRERAR